MADLMQNPDSIIADLLEAGALDAAALDPGAPIETGRRIVTFREDAAREGAAALEAMVAGKVAHSGDFSGHAVEEAGIADAAGLVFDEISVAVLGAEAGAALAEAMMASAGAADDSASDSAILAVEPEVLVFPAGISADEFLRGFAAASTAIRDGLVGRGAEISPAPPPGEDRAPDALAVGNTWGILATGAHASRFSGAGIKVAVLDTGFDFRHPDFAGRPIAHSSFIAGETAQDGHGHGTHCTGTACGPRAPAGMIPRYGVAFASQIFIGKVLSNGGGGTTATVLAGMNWAVANRCEVISLSLGGGGGPYVAYTAAGDAALRRGCLMIAAAGNDSRRPAVVRPCSAPANSPTIMSVAALEPNLTTAPYSNGPPIDIAGPGSSVFSSYPMPRRHATLSGTSMATPHVSGCAALLAQAGGPGMRAGTLRARLRAMARPLPGRPDVGAGLVQAVP